MANHTVTLNWISGGLRPDPDPVLAKTGDTISFRLGAVPADTSFKIKMHPPGVFLPAEAADAGPTIAVVETAITTYSCELTSEVGASLFVSEEDEGGHVRPG